MATLDFSFFPLFSVCWHCFLLSLLLLCLVIYFQPILWCLCYLSCLMMSPMIWQRFPVMLGTDESPSLWWGAVCVCYDSHLTFSQAFYYNLSSLSVCTLPQVSLQWEGLVRAFISMCQPYTCEWPFNSQEYVRVFQNHYEHIIP